MTPKDDLLDSIRTAVSQSLHPRPEVLAGWEGGSAAFGTVDLYSDLDLNFLVADDVSLDRLYAVVEDALNAISPITVNHEAPPGRYYKLRGAGDFVLLDLCFIRVSAPDHQLNVDRHGQPSPLFDKADWLERPNEVDSARAAQRQRRFAELQEWFLVSQSFVQKALLRGQRADAMAAYWSNTLRPLAELLRMRYCPARWDFGMRYLERDLPSAVHEQFCRLLYTRDLVDLKVRFAEARSWGTDLLDESQEQSEAP